MHAPRKRTSRIPIPWTALKIAAKFALPIGIVVWLSFHIDWVQLQEQPKNYGLLAVAFVIALSGVSLSFARWCLLVRCQGISLSVIQAFRISAICFLFNFVSVGSVGGDLFKALFLAKRRPGKRVEAVASVLVDRAVGLFGLVLLVAAAIIVTNPTGSSDVTQIRLDQIKFATAVLVFAGTFGLLCLVFGGKQIDKIIARSRTIPGVGAILAKVAAPLRMFQERRMGLLLAIVMSLGVHLLIVVSMYLIARSLYADPPTFADHLVIVPIGMLAAALPVAPAGLGVFEVVIQWLYEVIPAKPTMASGTLVALVFELVKITMAIVGTVFYWTANEEERTIIEESEELDH
ncbi:hypothetical protein Q31b_20240 [Novipirellula aureliae]|uniref:Flippase-like domain-containing protein n=1 Tax=Novipirellula aureliae TaxID=2527966 RepID=A0A5C6E262_9BACT|nr:lysylphosphatidylglycerol synthase transmembrane domain-containing protein [Novipirellula aureliae]TWU42990.1 hypothetical protein Q31b_20240 [Novipirellula aureliae]